MLVKTEAIIFSSIKYGDADLIVKAFTKSSGIKSYLIRGVLKSRKGKLRAAMFQPLTHLEIEANHKDKGTLESIKEAKVITHYRTLYTEISKSAIVFFLSDILRTAVQEEEENTPLFDFIVAAALWLDLHQTIGNFHVLFLLKLSGYLGFYPDDTHIEYQYFNLMDGLFETSETSIYSRSGKDVELLKLFLGINFDALSTVKLSLEQRVSFLNMLLHYYELHLYGFKKPRSLSVLNSIFN